LLPRCLGWSIFALVLGFALGGSFFWGVYGPNVTATQADAAYEQHVSEAPPEKESAEEALAHYTWWLTTFTCILAFATIGLGAATVGLYLTGEKQIKLSQRASLRQFRQTNDSLSLTKKSAEAAEQTAKAVVAVELPTIVFVAINLIGQGHVVIDGGMPPKISELELGFKNSGRTVATLIDQCIEHVVLDNLPISPDYRHIYPFVPGTLVEPGKVSPVEIQRYFINLTDEDRNAIESGSKSLWVYGYVAFRDFLGLRHESKFCAKWRPSSGPSNNSPIGFVYSSDTPPEYTRNS
jgi:hypothetical protein